MDQTNMAEKKFHVLFSLYIWSSQSKNQSQSVVLESFKKSNIKMTYLRKLTKEKGSDKTWHCPLTKLSVLFFFLTRQNIRTDSPQTMNVFLVVNGPLGMHQFLNITPGLCRLHLIMHIILEAGASGLSFESSIIV